MEKIKTAILGSGNIGTDLMFKLKNSQVLELTAMIGIEPDSDGLKKAKDNGYETFSNGIEGFLDQPELADIIFDATSAKAHIQHAKQLREIGKQVIDLTPAAVGPFIVPPVNLTEHLEAENINLISCGGQATIPIVHAISRIHPVRYAEIVATISSNSAGPGTRANIDEFTKTTASGIEKIGNVKKGKAIIILNPAEPPILMRNTIHALVAEGPVEEVDVIRSMQAMAREVQQYVPGFRLRQEPIIEGNQVTVFTEVEGAGDYLPPYSGNLDIMTAAAVKVAEEWAKHKLAKNANSS